MTRTKIEWADAVWNPVTGCTKVSEGCRNCYAERVVQRFGPRVHGEKPAGVGVRPRPFIHVQCHPDRLEQPLHWRKPRRVFVCSMGDLFHDDVPDEFLDRVFAVMALAPQHTFLALTKRPSRMTEYVGAVRAGRRSMISGNGGPFRFMDAISIVAWINRGLPNLWLGVSVENQATADYRIPLLLQTPAAIRFVSCEPMLGRVDFARWLRPRSVPLEDGYGGEHAPGFTSDMRVLDWVICGGESGPGARPMSPAWVHSLRDQCVAAGVPFFFKQWGEFADVTGHSRVGDTIVWPNGDTHKVHGGEFAANRYAKIMRRIGKKAAGRELDGRTHDETPEVTR